MTRWWRPLLSRVVANEVGRAGRAGLTVVSEHLTRWGEMGEQQSDATKQVVSAVLAEFQALQGEITNVLSAQQTIINIDITATAAIVGLVVTEKVDARLLLVAVGLSCALGLLYAANAFQITAIAHHIEAVHRPTIVEHTGDDRLLSWNHSFRGGPRPAPARLVRAVGVILLFLALPLVALVWVIPSMCDTWSWVAWGLSLCLFAVNTFVLIWGLRYVFRPMPSASSSRDPDRSDPVPGQSDLAAIGPRSPSVRPEDIVIHVTRCRPRR
jgi:hypothetical protein